MVVVLPANQPLQRTGLRAAACCTRRPAAERQVVSRSRSLRDGGSEHAAIGRCGALTS
jgi:hypothetical protein